jgi:hypothetical protein
MKLSDHFTLEEMIASQDASRASIDNNPPAYVYENLKMLAQSAEQVRTLLGFPMLITSGYRCPALNSLVGSKPTSAHTSGLAIDFHCPEFGIPLEICKAIAASEIPFDQVIHEFGSWCHFAITYKGLMGRKDLLTIDKSGTRKGLL